MLPTSSAKTVISRISLREFSKRANLSPSTVSRAFARPDMVSGETLERVMELARATGFRPSRVARAAVGESTHSIGVVLPTVLVSFFAEIAQGVQDSLLAHDYLPVLLTGQDDDILRGLQRLIDHRVDGLILAAPHEWLEQSQVVKITGENFPLVLVDQPHRSFTYDAVLNDDEGGGYQAGKHLTELGHRHVAVVRYGGSESNCVERLVGFTRALAEVGCQLRRDDVLINRFDLSAEESSKALRSDIEACLRQPASVRPTAIFATTDLFAKEVLWVAREVGVRVPQDLSVVGFADLNFADQIDPPLTSLRQNGQEIGRQAAEIIMARLAEPQREVRQVIVPTRLIVRKSTAGPLVGLSDKILTPARKSPSGSQSKHSSR